MRTKVDFAIVTPLEEERQAMLAKLPAAQIDPGGKRDPRVCYTIKLPVFRDGREGNYAIVVSDLLSMGRVDAAVATKDLLSRYIPRYILLTGIAGGLESAGVNVGDLLIADQIIDPEHQKLTDDGPEIRWSPYRVDPTLSAAARQLGPNHWQSSNGRPGPGDSRRHFGTMCTGDKVVANGSLNGYTKMWPGLIGVEMEAGGVACAAFQSVPAPGFFMVRGVSDLADIKKDSHQTKSWRSYACEVAASYVSALLKSAPVPLANGAANASRQPREEGLVCPKCGKRRMRVHSRSHNEFVMICDYCSTTAMIEQAGRKIASFIAPGVITLVGFEVIEHYVHEHGGCVVDSLLDIIDFIPDLF